MTKTITFCLFLFSFLSVATSQELSTEQQLRYNQTLDSLLDYYETYSCLTSNTSTFSSKYAERLVSMFSDGSKAKVVNDLPLKIDDKVITIGDYIELVKSNMPSGIDVIVKNVKKGSVHGTQKGYEAQVQITKSILGIYKDVQRFDHEAELEINLLLSGDLSDGKIVNIQKVERNEVPAMPKGLSGRQQVEEGQKGVFYSVDVASGVDYYSWELPKHWSGESSMNTIFVDFGEGASSGDLWVKAVNTYGESEPAILPLSVTHTSKEAPGQSTTSHKASWQIAGEGGLLMLNGDGDEQGALSIEGRLWAIYGNTQLLKGFMFNAKSGFGAAYYSFVLKDETEKDITQYLTTFEIPLMAGLTKSLKKWSISGYTGANVIVPFSAKYAYNGNITLGWISDLEASYVLNWFNGNAALYAGVRYNQLFGLKASAASTSKALGALGLHGGVRLNTAILEKRK